MAKRKNAPANKAIKPVQKSLKLKKAVPPKKLGKPVRKPVRKSRRLKKLAPVCNGLFCSDPGCHHGKKDGKAKPGSKKCTGLKKIQKGGITKKLGKRQQNKPVKCKRKKNRRKRPLTDFNRFVQHVSKRYRDAGKKMTGPLLIQQASRCWKALTPQQKAIFKCGGTEDTQVFKVGTTTTPAPPSTPTPDPENPPQPVAPQDPPPDPGTRTWPGNGSPYFLNGNFPF